MKQFFFTLTLAVAATTVLPAQVYSERMHNQHSRIRQGAVTGQLTRAEIATLQRQQSIIRREIREDLLDGGVFTPRERAQADRMLDNASRDIARLKHNRRVR